jgi:histidinol-phosphate aminotransferase
VIAQPTTDQESRAHDGTRWAQQIRQHLEQRGILIRYYKTPSLADCIRISVGTPQQNDAVLAALRDLA